MIDTVKTRFCTAVGVIGAAITSAFGGWDAAVVTLLIFMAVDYVTGLLVAGVFHASGKSQGGALESRAGFKGLCRKGMIVLFVLIACRLDMLLGVSYIRDGVVIGFAVNELLSIVENAGLMGLPLPAALTGVVDILSARTGEGRGHE